MLASIKSSNLFISVVVLFLIIFCIVGDILPHERDERHAIDTLPIKIGKIMMV